MRRASLFSARVHSDDGDPKILLAQIQLLYANAGFSSSVSLLAATILCFLQWGIIPNSVVLTWWFCISLITMLRYVVARRYRRTPPGRDNGAKWLFAFVAGAGLAGIGWGGACVFLYSPDHLLNQLFLIFVLGGMMLGAGSLLASRPEAYLAFLIPTGAAPAIRLFAQGDEAHVAMGLLAAVFTAATIITTGRIYRTVESSLKLKFENENLIADLKTAKERADSLNEVLEIRVQERTADLQESTEKLRTEILRRELMEQELLQARKLESLGVLAGGIAHDFNNFLTIVQGNIEMAQGRLNAGDSTHTFLQQAVVACQRAVFLSSQLLTFAKGGAPVRRVVSMTKLVTEAVQLARTGASTSFGVSIADNLWSAEVDPGQIGQVLHNILLNARQAMAGEGIIEVRAENVDTADSPAGSPLVRIVIRDYGCGIPAEVLPRIFDPYFTTKSGTSGLGLATAYAIVTKHGGRISAESMVGQWTEFTIDLPSSQEAIPAEAPIATPVRSGKERLLVMDDEEAIRNLLRVVLGKLGYDVETACDGAEAIALYEEAKARGTGFEAVLLDLTVSGGMGGLEAASKLKELDPDAKLVVCSGYSDATVMADHAAHGFSGVIQKPWTTGEIAAVFESLLTDRRKTR